MAIIFYYTPKTSAMRVHWALEEIGVPYEKVKVDLSAGEQKKPEFLKLNPNGNVPTMVIEGTPMFESLAMIQYLGERYGVEKGLWPAADSPARIEALSWSTWATVTTGSNGFMYMRNVSEHFPAEAKNAAQAETARQALLENLRILDERLSGRDYLLGASFTLCDVAVASVVFFLQFFKFDLSGYPRVGAWFARCAGRPAAIAALNS